MNPSIESDSKEPAQLLVGQRHRNRPSLDVIRNEVREGIPITAGFIDFLEPIPALLYVLVRDRTGELESPVGISGADFDDALPLGVAVRKFRPSCFNFHDLGPEKGATAIHYNRKRIPLWHPLGNTVAPPVDTMPQGKTPPNMLKSAYFHKESRLAISRKSAAMEAGGIEPPSCGILTRASTCVVR